MTALHIHCWRNDYRVPDTLAAGPAAAHELDRLAQRLAEALAEQADFLPETADGGVILLPELAVDCDIGLDCGADQVVRHWSRQLAAALGAALDEGRALRFPSQAAYQARFMADLVAGRAWSSWMYHPFDGLRMLPAGAVIRTLLEREAGAGCETLALIEAASWPLLLAALPVREALRILAAWDEDRQPPGNPDIAARLAAWATSRPALPGAHAPPLTALWLLGAWRRAGLQGPVPVGAACWTAALLALPGEPTAVQLQRLARSADAAALRAAAQACDHPDWLLLLAAAARDEREAAARAARSLKLDSAASQPAPGEDTVLDAPCAGLAWLLPVLRGLLQEPVLATLPAPAGCGRRDLATACTLALAAGPRGEQAWRDPFWRAFLRIPEAGADLHAWLAGRDPAPACAALPVALRRQAMGTPVLLRYRQGATRRQVTAIRESACRLGDAHTGERGPVLAFAERLALTRLLRRDDAWLAMSPMLARLPAPWRAPFALLAQAALRLTANRIPGAARCSLPYLFANVLGVGGQARSADGAAWALAPARPPLHVLLSLNGMARLRLDWPDGRSLALQCAD